MSTAERARQRYRFGKFSLDLDRGTLYRGHRELHLRPKAFGVLAILLENSGRLVSKAELHDAVWKQSVVTDDSLAHCVADIRRSLGDSGFEIIKTVPRRGYVFDHAVSHEGGVPAVPPPQRRRLTYRMGALAASLVAAILLLLGGERGGEIPAAGAAPGDDSVATALELDPLSTDINALNDYQRGRFFFKRRGEGDLERAEASFKSALEQDPDIADAWIGLAGVYSVRFGSNELGPEEALPLLGDATRHAVSLAPGSAEAHLRRANYYQATGKAQLAEQHMETAMALDPNDVLALGKSAGYHAHRGRFDEAVELQRRAVQGDPTSVLQHHNLVAFLLVAGRYAEAAVAAEVYRALYSPGIDDAGELFADVEILQGNYEQALVQVRSIANGPPRERNLAIIHHELQQEAEADAALQRLLAIGGEEAAIHAAEVYARRGQADEAIRLLFDVLDSPQRDAPEQRELCQYNVWLLSPYLAGLRSDARWQALYAQVLEARGYSTMLARAGNSGAAVKN